MRILGSVIVGATLAFGTITWWALESGDVAVIATVEEDGSRRATRVWVVRHEGSLWLEAATPQREWYQNIQRHPAVTLTLGGHKRQYRAQGVPTIEGHALIRSLLREKYGLRDWWVGQLQDTSRSVAVRLTRLGP